jgi:ABC-2 type transport system permease protein
VLTNKTSAGIDSILIYFDRITKMNGLQITGAAMKSTDPDFGHYWMVLQKTLLPGDSTVMDFTFSSSWSSFNEHVPFNSIVNNGSFSRISNFFPKIGYNNNNEITNSIERHKRLMKDQALLTSLEDTAVAPYEFINLDATISTSAGQTAIGIGKLAKQWQTNNRNYFHYTASQVPFRFALSSAAYSVKRGKYRNIPIEIYYHPSHSVNVDKLVSNVVNTLAYCENNFGPYQYDVIRFAEVSAFAEGFGATAYPATIFMKENGGFYNMLSKGNEEDAINQLAGHELSHQWWGTAQIVPQIKEGSWILTETLAKYTELMIFKNEHGNEAMREVIRHHIDLYLANRSFSKETPLYKTTFETPHLAYNKGMVVMYQLYLLLGEKTVNLALHNFYLHNKYPNPAPVSNDFLNELYASAPSNYHARIDELFKQIITFDSKITLAHQVQKDGLYEITFEASVNKFREVDGQQLRMEVDSMQAGVLLQDGRLLTGNFKISEGKLRGRFITSTKAAKIAIDPLLTTIDTFLKDNERSL